MIVNLVKKQTLDQKIPTPILDRLWFSFSVKDYKYVTYSKIHAYQPVYNIGNVSNDIFLDLELWNAYEFEAKTLYGLSYNDLSGVEVLDANMVPLEFPIIISKLGNIKLKIKVTTEGDSSADGNISFDFGDKNIYVGLTLSRSILFDFDVNALRATRETYTYNTYISKSMNGTEQRIPRIATPRLQVEYYYTLTDKQRRSIEGYLYNGNSTIALPMYHQMIFVNTIVNENIYIDTKNTCLQPGMDILIKDNYTKEIVRVKEVYNDHIVLTTQPANIYSNAIIYPIYAVKLMASNTKTITTKDMCGYTIRFEKITNEIDYLVTNNAIEFNKYKGEYILEDQNTNEELEISYVKDIEEFDNGYSKKEYAINNDIAVVTIPFSNYIESHDEISRVKNLFKNQRGRLKDIYSRSFNNNVKVVDNIASGDIMIYVENNDLTSFFTDAKIKHIYFKYNDNKEKILEIVSINRISDEKEMIILSGGFGEAIAVEDVISSDFVYHGRIDDDELTIEYYKNDLAKYALNFYKNNDIE